MRPSNGRAQPCGARLALDLARASTDRRRAVCRARAVGLKPSDPSEPLAMQNKELNNGRLAMIGIAGMIVQEGVAGGKIF